MRVLFIDFNPFGESVTPISIGHLGAVLAARGDEVRIWSLGSSSVMSPHTVRRALAEFAPDLLGFGVYQRNLFHVRALAAMAREVVPHARIAFGGPQATFIPEAGIRELDEVHYVCRGEGEVVIRLIAESIEGGSPDTPIPGVTTRLPDGSCLNGPPLIAPRDLDIYPSPWLTGVLDPTAHDECIMLTSRGCPHRCTFCYTPSAFDGKVRSQSVERVLEDISWVAEHGSGRLWFADPNFSYSKRRIVAILEGILTRSLEVEMWIETRADMLTTELLTLMKRAGVYLVAMGLESASPAVVPHLQKHLEPERVGEAARAALAMGLDVELFSQYGLPGETFDDAVATLEFVRGCGVAVRGNSNAQQMQLYFGSAINEQPSRYGVRPLRPQLPPYMSIGMQFETAWMTHDEIKRMGSLWRAESLDGGKRVVS